MANEGGLINLGNISKPATVLIEKISDAIGGIAKPWQTRRVARAEAEAALIEANTRVQISEIEKRALIRMVREEGKKQENIENITAQALPNLRDDAKPENVEQDWLTHFFDRCRLVSDEQMQAIWSGVLAGEANAPGSFAKRTIELLAILDKKDAELFAKLCSYIWIIGEATPLIYDHQHEIYNQADLNFATLSHLDSLGLIKFIAVGNYERLRLPKVFPAFYGGKPVLLEFPNDTGNTMHTGQVMLTRIGHDLMRIVASTPSEQFKEYVLKKWQDQGYKILPLQNAPHPGLQ